MLKFVKVIGLLKVDMESNLEKGFRRYVQVYKEVVYINTFTGEGFDKVLELMDPLLRKMASKLYMSSHNFEDIKSELSIILIEGIRMFDPDRNVKLSTFLQTHLHNKSISWIRGKNGDSKDASSLLNDKINKQEFKKVKPEINFSQFEFTNDDSGSVLFENTITESDVLYFNNISDYDLVNFNTDLLKISSKLDDKTRKIIELVYFEDYSIKDAADKVGLTGWAASIRLKRLASRGTFKSIFN